MDNFFEIIWAYTDRHIERQRQTDTQTDTHRHIQTDTQTHREKILENKIL